MFNIDNEIGDTYPKEKKKIMTDIQEEFLNELGKLFSKYHIEID